MAVVARSETVMACFLPAVKLLAHDMAVDARRGIVGQVGEAGGIAEREAAEAEDPADQREQAQCIPARPGHTRPRGQSHRILPPGTRRGAARPRDLIQFMPLSRLPVERYTPTAVTA